MSLSEGLALVFDLDCVIVDSMPVHTQAWNVYLRRFGIPSNDLEERMYGLRNDDIVRNFFGAGLSAREIFEHGAAKEQLYRELTGADLESHMVPGIAEFLHRYSAAPMAVASNAEPANIDFVLNGAGLRHRFKVIVDGMQVHHPKPFPDVYLKAADELGIVPENCIVFEDSPAGVRAARAACSRVVGVETHASVEDVDFRVPDFRASGLDQWLAKQRAV